MLIVHVSDNGDSCHVDSQGQVALEVVASKCAMCTGTEWLLQCMLVKCIRMHADLVSNGCVVACQASR